MAQDAYFKNLVADGASQLINWLQEIRNADPAFAAGQNSRIWYHSGDNALRTFIGGIAKTFAFAEDLEAVGTIIGELDLTNPGVPADLNDADLTLNSKGADRLSAGDAAIRAGDLVVITTAPANGAVIAGIIGDDNLQVGDMLMALDDSPTGAAQWIGMQSNITVTGGFKQEEVTMATLAANTSTPVPLLSAPTSIGDVEIWSPASGFPQSRLHLQVTRTAANTIAIESNTALTDILVIVQGTDA